MLSSVERARRYLAKMRPGVSGERGHNTTFHAACVLLGKFGLTEEAAFALLVSDFNPRCRPPWEGEKLAKKVRDAMRQVNGQPSCGVPAALIAAAPLVAPTIASQWLQPDPIRRAEITAHGPNMTELCDKSPNPFTTSGASKAPEIVEQLFSTPELPDPLVCVGKCNSVFATSSLSTWVRSGKLPENQFVVPSPMSKQSGFTKEGRLSEHCLDNTGPRRFLVVEFDGGTADEHAALLWHLRGFGPLVMVIHSGGKSLHGWFYCRGLPECALQRFFAYAVSIGADRALWTRSQFVRLPAGQRIGGKRQHVLYFDPAAICNL